MSAWVRSHDVSSRKGVLAAADFHGPAGSGDCEECWEWRKPGSLSRPESVAVRLIRNQCHKQNLVWRNYAKLK